MKKEDIVGIRGMEGLGLLWSFCVWAFPYSLEFPAKLGALDVLAHLLNLGTQVIYILPNPIHHHLPASFGLILKHELPMAAYKTKDNVIKFIW